LDQHYVAARYPDALPGGAPYQVFSKKQASEALTFAALFITAAEKERAMS
jgi:HEPN domain-containing protein